MFYKGIFGVLLSLYKIKTSAWSKLLQAFTSRECITTYRAR